MRVGIDSERIYSFNTLFITFVCDNGIIISISALSPAFFESPHKSFNNIFLFRVFAEGFCIEAAVVSEA